MKSDGKIAQVRFEPRTHNLHNITFYIRNLRFKCKRCATFCCKLGGPSLSLKDVERLKKAGHCEHEFLDATQGGLKNTAFGSCIFLTFDKQKSAYRCIVYRHRPALCRLYPFHFEKTSPNSFVLKVMACSGISYRAGELVNEMFIIAHLYDALKELCLKPKFY